MGEPKPDATSGDQLAEDTDNSPTPEDGPQDIPQEPVNEADIPDEDAA